jgi:hypothetical protein
MMFGLERLKNIGIGLIQNRVVCSLAQQAPGWGRECPR